MNKIVLAVILAFAITFTINACSSSDDNGSGDNAKKYNYCVYVEQQICLSGSFETYTNGGVPSDGCPNFYGDIDLRPSSSSGGNASGTFNDSRNNETYKWVRIGNQVWMARNLNYRVNESNTVIGT